MSEPTRRSSRTATAARGSRPPHGHPLRTLLAFLLVLLALFGLMAGLKTWKPKLGLDLQGGTTITLTAANTTGSGQVDDASLELARGIIQRRVDSMGVGEVTVTTATTGNNKQIIVSAPGTQRDELVALVGQTAQLMFRQVIGEVPVQPAAQPSAQPSDATPAAGEPSAEASIAEPGASASATTEATPTGNRRPMPGLPTAPPAPHTPRPTTGPAEPQQIDKSLQYEPTQQDYEEFSAFQCGDEFPDVMDQPLIACDQNKTTKYFLGPVLVPGNAVSTATAGIPPQQLGWQVNLEFTPQGRQQFGDVTKQLVGKQQPQNQLAIVLDGAVVSAPTIQSAIEDGRADITGSFNQESATNLANVLKYGALPLAFTVSSVDNVSPTLGSDQLRAGLLAGLIGLSLVVLYALLYYRALALSVVASLGLAGALTYAMLVLLGRTYGYALSLAGIAGVIVAIGITADSFIIYFERIRDEMREGRSLRAAIETGWRKARGTIVVADGVSLLSSIVLYVLALGAVKGFAFTLGLTTLIDLAIVFFFTHPFLTLLGRTEFFGGGHRFSGLDPEHMGVDREAVVRRNAERTRAEELREARARRLAAHATSATDAEDVEGADPVAQDDATETPARPAAKRAPKRSRRGQGQEAADRAAEEGA